VLPSSAYSRMDLDDAGPGSETVNFLSALSQITATVLAIFAAAFAAYFVFLEDRAAQLNDAATQDKIGITRNMRDVRIAWRPVLVGQVSNESFEEHYQRLSKVRGLQLIDKALNDLSSNSEEFEKAARDIQPRFSLDAPSSRWIVRWALSKSIAAIAVQTPTQSGISCTPQAYDMRNDFEQEEDEWGCRLASRSLFPLSGLGPGFDGWHETFRDLLPRIGSVVSWSEGHGIGTTAAGASGRDPLPRGPSSNDWEQLGGGGSGGCGCGGGYFHGIAKPNAADRAALRRVYDLLLRARERVDDYDRVQAQVGNYAFFQKIHVGPIVVLLFTVAVLGVFLPLMAIALRWDVPRVWSIADLCGIFLASAGAILIFVVDAASPPAPTANYLAERWLRPMHSTLEGDRATISKEDQLIGLGLYSDFLNDPDGKRVPWPLSVTLQRYVTRAESYNAAVLAYDSETFRILRTHAYARAIVKSPTVDDIPNTLWSSILLVENKGSAEIAVQNLRSRQPGSGVVIVSRKGKMWIPDELSSPHAGDVLEESIAEARQATTQDGLAPKFAALHVEVEQLRTELLRLIETYL
jgi:hypothetical protein